MDKMVLELDGMDIRIKVTKHAARRMSERAMDVMTVIESILDVGSKILDVPANTEILISDSFRKETVVLAFDLSEGLDIFVVTVIDSSRVKARKGQVVFSI